MTGTHRVSGISWGKWHQRVRMRTGKIKSSRAHIETQLRQQRQQQEQQNVRPCVMSEMNLSMSSTAFSDTWDSADSVFMVSSRLFSLRNCKTSLITLQDSRMSEGFHVSTRMSDARHRRQPRTTYSDDSTCRFIAESSGWPAGSGATGNAAVMKPAET